MQQLIQGRLTKVRIGLGEQHFKTVESDHDRWSIYPWGHLRNATEQVRCILWILKRLHENNEYTGARSRLSIGKRIFDGNQGRICLDFEVGVKRVFYFTFPKEFTNALKQNADNSVIG